MPPRRESFGQFARATGNFAAANKIGEGATGEVFRGRDVDGTVSAIKVLKILPGVSPEART